MAVPFDNFLFHSKVYLLWMYLSVLHTVWHLFILRQRKSYQQWFCSWQHVSMCHSCLWAQRKVCCCCCFCVPLFGSLNTLNILILFFHFDSWLLTRFSPVLFQYLPNTFLWSLDRMHRDLWNRSPRCRTLSVCLPPMIPSWPSLSTQQSVDQSTIVRKWCWTQHFVSCLVSAILNFWNQRSVMPKRPRTF